MGQLECRRRLRGKIKERTGDCIFRTLYALWDALDEMGEKRHVTEGEMMETRDDYMSSGDLGKPGNTLWPDAQLIAAKLRIRASILRRPSNPVPLLTRSLYLCPRHLTLRGLFVGNITVVDPHGARRQARDRLLVRHPSILSYVSLLCCHSHLHFLLISWIWLSRKKFRVMTP